MAELRGLSVKVPIKFSEKAQRDLYEMCLAYKELAEARGVENEKLRRLLQISLAYCANGYCEDGDGCPLREGQNACSMCAEARELGVEVDE